MLRQRRSIAVERWKDKSYVWLRGTDRATEGNKIEVPMHPTGDYLADQAA